MRLPLALLGTLAMTLPALPADFPPPDKLPQHPGLPDPTVMLDGTKVTTKEQWESKRRPELQALFEHYMYGKYPAKPKVIRWKPLFQDRAAFGGKGTLREVEVTFSEPEGKVYVLEALPNDKPRAACFVGPNFGGNHLLTADERVRIPTAWVPDRYPGVKGNKATAEGRGKQADTWPLEQIVGRGYGVVTFYCGDIQPDRPNVREGMRATLPEHKGGPPGDETATIMWWAWGVNQVVEYHISEDAAGQALADPTVLARRRKYVVVGHSRLGKTALLAGAFNPVIDVVIPHQAGCGGTGPSRHADPKAETVKRINTSFPHWFCGNFKAFNDDTTRLPFDQNCLVAICAPRPVLFTNAAEDLWANPAGQFEVLKAANPAYQLLGVEGITAGAVPKPGEPLIDSRLGYWIRPGTHAMTPADWKVFTDYGDKWLK